MSQLREAVDALVAVATEAGLPPDRARDEAMVFAAAIAEAAPRAAQDWCAAIEGAPTELAAVNAAFFDGIRQGAHRGRLGGLLPRRTDVAGHGQCRRRRRRPTGGRPPGRPRRDLPGPAPRRPRYAALPHLRVGPDLAHPDADAFPVVDAERHTRDTGDTRDA